jgi:AcrR family transcriptional regulator
MTARLLFDRPDLDRHDTRARIMAAAERLFRHFGYAKTTVADIARDLGMSPANIYRFFDSKAALVEAMAERLLAERTAAADAIVAGPGNASERLTALLMAEHCNSRDLMMQERNFHELVRVAVEEQWRVIQGFKRRLDGQIARLVEEGIAAGEFPPRDAGLAARCISQAFAICYHPMLLDDPIDEGTRTTPDEMIDFILDALRGHSPRAA